MAVAEPSLTYTVADDYGPTRVLFFFQAEDGIRDIGVTGVQTCALPISTSAPRSPSSAASRRRTWSTAGVSRSRSEERRVGKECRSRWSPYHQKKKQRVAGAENETRWAHCAEQRLQGIVRRS